MAYDEMSTSDPAQMGAQGGDGSRGLLLNPVPPSSLHETLTPGGCCRKRVNAPLGLPSAMRQNEA